MSERVKGAKVLALGVNMRPLQFIVESNLTNTGLSIQATRLLQIPSGATSCVTVQENGRASAHEK